MRLKKSILTGLTALSAVTVLAADITITVPEDASIILGSKTSHFVDFTEYEPKSVTSLDGIASYTFDIPAGKVYNYRTWMEGGLTNAGYFTMNADNSKCPVLSFTAEDYKTHSPKEICHDVMSNAGYETGDIFLNINPEGYLKLNTGDNFDLHAMRSWELTDNAVNNYFIEPEFHYEVIDSEGNPSNSVITIESRPQSSWASLKALAPGMAIVLVTYDAINLDYYSGNERKDYLGGSFWGAIWPENTGVFVVSVDESESACKPHMLINEEYNADTKKMAGKYVDAEHDVFYYMKGGDGFRYTFRPENVSKVEIAYPTIGEQSLTFSGFTADGVEWDENGTVAITLKQGRQIVRLTDPDGNSVCQVMTAKECEREISNLSRPGSSFYQPGDKIQICYKGLRHPANKLAGIYNMSAYITYNGIPNGTSLIQSANQYTFGSSQAAQTVIATIPEDLNVDAGCRFVMDDGVVQVNGFGDPIGNHRTIIKDKGRSPNLNAVSHQTYFGSLPPVEIPISPMTLFSISLSGDLDDAEVKVTYEGNKELQPDNDGIYSWTFGTYNVVVKKCGFRCFRTTFVLREGDDVCQTVKIDPVPASEGMWNGISHEEVLPDENGVYHVANGAQLAYFSEKINELGKTFTSKVVLDCDIDLGDYDWTPIAKEKNKNFAGQFDGQNHTVTGLYINDPSLSYAGLFGFVQGLSTSVATIENLTVEGAVASNKYVGGIAGDVDKYSAVRRCANHAHVEGDTYVGGVAGYLSASAKCSLTDCYNTADISGNGNVGGVVGYNNASAQIKNIFSIGKVAHSATSGACVGGSSKKNGLENAFSIYKNEIETNQTQITEEQLESGEIAFKLGAEFGQAIGTDPYPIFDGTKVYYDSDSDEYYNKADNFSLDLGEGTDEIIIEDDGIVIPLCGMYRISVKAEPVGARLPEISWISDNDDIVSIDDEGNLTAVSKGMVNISAVAVIEDKEVIESCHVNVVGAKAKTLILESNTLTLDVIACPVAVLSAGFGPDYADVPEVKWTSSNESVAKAVHDGSLSAQIMALSEGETMIKVELSDNPDVYDVCALRVTEISGIDDIIKENASASVDVFDLDGRIVRTDANLYDCKALSPGLYIFRINNIAKTVMIK